MEVSVGAAGLVAMGKLAAPFRVKQARWAEVAALAAMAAPAALAALAFPC